MLEITRMRKTRTQFNFDLTPKSASALEFAESRGMKMGHQVNLAVEAHADRHFRKAGWVWKHRTAARNGKTAREES